MSRAAPMRTAWQAGLVGCLHCGDVWAAETPRCGRCGARLSSRYPGGLQRVWAWWLAGVIAYIPANIYPMLQTETLGSASGSTIVGGVVELIHHGAWFVAFVVFFASVVIPVAKFLAIGWLALAVRRPVRPESAHGLHRAFEIVEFIGRWSMIDVFVVAILSALVHLGTIVEIFPGIAAVSFALSVVFTMLAALNFDPRLIWDRTAGA